MSSVQFSHSVVSDSLWPHELQHARPPCPSPSIGVHSDSRPLSRWCHPAISSWVVPFSSCPQSLPASQSFPMSQLVPWGVHNTGASALASFLPKISQGNSDRVYFSGLQNHCRWYCSHEIKRCSLLGRKVMSNLDSIFKAEKLLCWLRSI